MIWGYKIKEVVVAIFTFPVIAIIGCTLLFLDMFDAFFGEK